MEGTGDLKALSRSFDLQWQGPAFIDQLVEASVNPLKVYQRAERPLPVYAGHLTAVKSTRILAAFDSKSPVLAASGHASPVS